MSTLTDTTAIARVRAAFDRRLIDRLLPVLFHAVGGEKRPLALRSGNQIKFRQFTSLTANTTPITEGVTPSGTYIADSKLTSTIGQYADYVILTDIAEKTDETALQAEAIDLIAEQAGNSMDRVIRDTINAGTYLLRCSADATYSTSAARTTVNYKFCEELAGASVRQLEGYNVKKFKNPIKASTGVGTVPIPESYIMITHPDVVYDMRLLEAATPGFIPVHKYATGVDLMDGEVGAWTCGIRVVATTNAKTWTSAGATATTYRYTGSTENVYSSLVFGQGFYGLTDLDGGIKTIIKGLGSAGSADPLDQRSTVAWKADHVTTILNDYCGVRIETCATL